VAPSKTDSPRTALEYLIESANWYTSAAKRARVAFFVSETTVLIVAAAIPATAAFTADRRVPAALGAVVVVLTGLRSVFRWRDSWTRFTEAFLQLETARQLYVARAGPYSGEDCDIRLTQRVTQIRTTETLGWIAMRRSDESADQTKPT
jgi:Protein of unknown function (DUF4231)